MVARGCYSGRGFRADRGMIAPVQLVFIVFKYFPYGGLQRDLQAIAAHCLAAGHGVTVLCRQWEGEVPPGIERVELPVAGISNHGRDLAFVARVQEALRDRPHDLVVGFNKMPGLDCYYAADTCYLAKVMEERGALSRHTRRFKVYSGFERAVFTGATELLMISANEIEVFRRYYGTPAQRFHLLPPGIRRDRIMPPDYRARRARFRDQWKLAPEDRLVLLVGSGFRTKGLDRAIAALASLPAAQRGRVRLFVIGQDRHQPFEAQARRAGVGSQVAFLGGRDDIPEFLWGADLLIHPAYRENTGTVLLEAMVAGLPVLTTDVCGYAHYVADQGMGRVLPSPYVQDALDRALAELLFVPGADWPALGEAFAASADIYSMPQRAAELITALGERRATATAS